MTIPIRRLPGLWLGSQALAASALACVDPAQAAEMAVGAPTAGVRTRPSADLRTSWRLWSVPA